MEQEQPLTPEQPSEPSLAQRLERQLAKEAGEDWTPPAPPPPDLPEAVGQEVEAPAESDPAEATEEAQAQPVSAEVEIDGKTYQVPPELKDGYLRQSDYTKKTQQIAQERNAALAIKQTAEQALAVAQQMGPLLAEFHQRQAQAQQYQRVDWHTAYQTDPTGANRARLEANENWARLQTLGQALQQAPNVLKELQAKTLAEETARQRPKALEIVPDLDKRAPEFIEIGKSYGYTDDEMSRLTDARSIAMLRDLAEFKSLTANRDLVRQKVTSVPPVAKPGARAAAPQASAKDYQASLRKLRTDRTDDAFVAALRMQRKTQG